VILGLSRDALYWKISKKMIQYRAKVTMTDFKKWYVNGAIFNDLE